MMGDKRLSSQLPTDYHTGTTAVTLFQNLVLALLGGRLPTSTRMDGLARGP